VHSDSAPTVYVSGNPGPDDASVRQLEHDLANLKEPDPYIKNGQLTPVTYELADPAEEAALHMVNADPARTPTFTDFGQDDFFFTASAFNPSCGGNPCVSPGFAWNHGDSQQEISNTWVGMVGPGVQNRGVDSRTWTDHVNIRPTIMALTGLTDDYVEDGRVLTEALQPWAIPPALLGTTPLATLYEQLNAPFGQFGMDTLEASTKAIEGSDSSYETFDSQLTALTAERNALAQKIDTALHDAAFEGQRINLVDEGLWLLQGTRIIVEAAALEHSQH